MATELTRARRLLAAVVAIIVLLAPGVGGCKIIPESGCEVTAEPDPRVFTLFCGLIAGGYGGYTAEPSGDPGTSTGQLRERVLATTGDLDQASRDVWKSLLVDEVFEDLISYALAAGPPPDFAPPESETGSLAPPALTAGLRELWAACASTLYDESLQGQLALVEPLVADVPDILAEVQAYSRAETIPRKLKLLPVPLAAWDFSYSCLNEATGTAYVLIGPLAGAPAQILAREAFRLCLGPDAFGLYLGHRLLVPSDSLLGILDMSSYRQCRFGKSLELRNYLEENAVRSLALRAFPPDDIEGALSDQRDSGFALVPEFYEGLAAYEAGDGTLDSWIGPILSGIDFGAIYSGLAPPPLPPPPEGYPPLPEGWEWQMWSFKGTTGSSTGYEAVGTLSGPPRAPFAGSVTNIWAATGAGISLDSTSLGWWCVIIMDGATDAPLGTKWSEGVAQGDPLHWVTGGKVRIRLDANLSLEEKEEVLNWLLNGG